VRTSTVQIHASMDGVCPSGVTLTCGTCTALSLTQWNAVVTLTLTLVQNSECSRYTGLDTGRVVAFMSCIITAVPRWFSLPTSLSSSTPVAMHSTVTAPSLLSVTRLTTLVVSTLVSLSSGSNYVRYVNLTFARIDSTSFAYPDTQVVSGR
jgi:hypothetical protein